VDNRRDGLGLVDDQVNRYWSEVTDAHPGRSGQRVQITNPLASTLDWRLRAPQPPSPATQPSTADRACSNTVEQVSHTCSDAHVRVERRWLLDDCEQTPVGGTTSATTRDLGPAGLSDAPWASEPAARARPERSSAI
jgi:hypothetical protein